MNGLDSLAITKLDVLDDLDELLVCTAYRCGGTLLQDMPGDVAQLASASRSTRRSRAGRSPTKGITAFDALPAAAQRYIQKLEETSGVRASIISTGSDREHTIVGKI